MSTWDGSKTEMWKIAQKYTLADDFFMGAFGGSFFNHQWLICACAPLLRERGHQSREAVDRGGGPGRHNTDAGGRLTEVGDGRHPEVRRRR